MKVLIVFGDYVYPDNHGGRRDVWDRIKRFYKNGYKIDLICTVKSTIADADITHVDQYICNQIILNRTRPFFYLFSSNPYQFVSRKMLKEVRLVDEYDFCLLEGDYVLPILDNSSLNSKKIYIRKHNDEEQYFYELARTTKSILRKVFYNIEGIRLGRKWTLYKKSIDKFFWISDKEHRECGELEKSRFLPTTINSDGFIEHYRKRENNVLFIGSMFMPNNWSGLLWYLNNVHPLLIQKIDDYRLIIAGTCSNKVEIQRRKVLSKYKHLSFYPNAESLDDLYFKSKCFINPMLNGAGVKLKTVDAIRMGMPVVSTTVGAEGMLFEHGNHLLIGDTPKKFFESICELLTNEKLCNNLVRNAQKHLKELSFYESFFDREITT